MRKRNVAKSVSHPHVYEYIDDRMRAAYLYFANPQTKDGPLYTMADANRLQMKLRENMSQAHELSHGSSESPQPEDGATSSCRCPLTANRSTPGKSGNKDEKSVARDQSDNATQRTSRLSESGSNKSKNTEHSSCSFSTFLQGFTNSVWQEAISDVTHRVGDNIGASDNDTNSVQQVEKSLFALSVTDTEETKERLSESSDANVERQGKVFDVSKNPSNVNEDQITESGKNMNESEHEDEEDAEDVSDEDDTDEEEEDMNKTSKDEDSEMCSPTHRKCNGGIRDLYDERLMHNLKREDFVFTFDAKDLIDEKVKYYAIS